MLFEALKENYIYDAYQQLLPGKDFIPRQVITVQSLKKMQRTFPMLAQGSLSVMLTLKTVHSGKMCALDFESKYICLCTKLLQDKVLQEGLLAKLCASPLAIFCIVFNEIFITKTLNFYDHFWIAV